MPNLKISRKSRCQYSCRYDWACIWASINGHLDVVEYLVNQGANIHADRDCAC